MEGLKPKLMVLLIGANKCGNKSEDTVQGIETILAELRRRLMTPKFLKADGSLNRELFHTDDST